MEGVTHDENSNFWSKDGDQFPKGLRVLLVDDNVTCLHLLEKMLRDCSYRVTKCERGEDALSMIRENKGRFDIVLTDVHMPGMDGFQLLAKIAAMGITLPVVMFSSDAEKDTVVKGVNSGACNYLVKPIQVSTLKILWQHVLRSNPSSSNNSTKEFETSHLLTTSSSDDSHTRAENEEVNSKSLKKGSEDEANHGKNKVGAKKPRVVWTSELNRTFVMAVNSLGNHDVKPKKILQIMRKMTSVPHLTRQNVSSHLQKYRTNSKKIGEASEHQNATSSLINGPGFTNPTPSPPPSIGCGGIQKYAAAAQYPSQAMSIAPQQHCTGCSSRMPNPVEFPHHNALPRYQMGLQSQPLAPLQQPHLPLQNYGRQQQVNESVQCLPYAPAPSVGFAPPMNNAPPVLPKQSDNSLIMQMSHTPTYMQIPDAAAHPRHYLSATTHHHPLHSQIPTHAIQSLNSSTPNHASEQGPLVALSTIGVNESYGSNIAPVKGEFSYQNNHNPVVEDRQVSGNEAMFTDMLDTNFLDDLGFLEELGLGEDAPFLDSNIQDNGAM
ncbi:two-component response regulator ARR2-like [Eucalyptus grandis]|uniref:two-component response regulator ARR2-like n=1 Tax=Eucalyptus grandis TaxID=71139 RepID=UPI00192EF317|nr:two-component response regulator ARR2-like [Eucalyptus grandis]